jgi:PAS domain S-box-containing protein
MALSYGSVPPMVMAGITVYVGLYHLLIYSRRRRHRENLTFALTCFAVALYDLFCVGLYGALSVAEGAQWQRAQVVTLALCSLGLLWFVVDYTSYKPRAGVYVFTACFILAGVVGLVDRSGLTWRLDQPSVKLVLLPFGFMVGYYEVAPGPLTDLQSVMGVLLFLYILWIIVRFYRRGQRRKAKPLFVTMVILFAGVFNDTLVSSGVYEFIYMMEYAYTGVVLLMTYSLTDTVAKAAAMEEALRESEERYRAVSELTSDFAYAFGIGPDGTLVPEWVTEAFTRITGYTAEEVRGRGGWYSLVHPDDLAMLHERAWQLIARPEEGEGAHARPQDTGEIRIVAKDGETRWLNVFGRLIWEESWDKPVRIVGAAQDVTERKRAEAERERLLADLVWRSTQLITAVEVSKSASTILEPKDLIEEAVNVIRERFGFYYVGLFLVEKAGEYAVLRAGTGEAGKQMLAAGHKLSIGGRSMIGQCLARSEARFAPNVIEEAVRFDNPYLPETRSEMALPLLSRGRCIGALTVQSAEEAAFSADDVAALQAMADQLAIALTNARLYDEVQRYAIHLEDLVRERTAELAAVNKELEAFAYSVSHDLRAPLRSVNGFSQALLEDYAGVLDATGQDYLRRVRAASQRMSQLIDDLLDLSRLTRHELHFEEVDLSALARDIAEELRATQPEREVEFVIEEGIRAKGDAHLLHAALVNLMGNAWKFTAKHPQARIEFGRTEIEGTPTFFVRDDGAGFDMAYSSRLFGAFQRLHGADEFEGTGVGLATVQRIIHRHGGRVWAEGAVEEGATFWFTLGLRGG